MKITGEFLTAINLVNSFFLQVNRSDASTNIIVSNDGDKTVIAAGTFNGGKKAIYMIDSATDEKCKWLLDASVAAPLLKKFENGDIVETGPGILTLSKGKKTATIPSSYGADIESSLDSYIEFTENIKTVSPFKLKTEDFLDGINSVLYAADNDETATGFVTVVKSADKELTFEAFNSYQAARCKEALEAETKMEKIIIPRWQADYLVSNTWGSEEISLYDINKTITVQIGSILISSLKYADENSKKIDVSKIFDLSKHKVLYFAKNDLLDFLDTAEIIAKKSVKKSSVLRAVEMTYNRSKPEIVTFSYKGAAGEIVEEITLKATPDFENMRIGINQKMFRKVLNDIGEEVGIAIETPLKPIAILDANKANLKRIMATVRLR